MKDEREHRVPLGDRALAILELVRGLGGVYVFPGMAAPGRPARPLSPMALAMCLRGLRPGVTVHGFRSSFRDWCGEATSFAPDLAEAALAHVAGSVERAYRRGDALERRRELMAAWERFLDPVAVDNVTPLRRVT
jgi:integrase